MRTRTLLTAAALVSILGGYTGSWLQSRTDSPQESPTTLEESANSASWANQQELSTVGYIAVDARATGEDSEPVEQPKRKPTGINPPTIELETSGNIGDYAELRVRAEDNTQLSAIRVYEELESGEELIRELLRPEDRYQGSEFDELYIFKIPIRANAPLTRTFVGETTDIEGNTSTRVRHTVELSGEYSSVPPSTYFNDLCENRTKIENLVRTGDWFAGCVTGSSLILSGSIMDVFGKNRGIEHVTLLEDGEELKELCTGYFDRDNTCHFEVVLKDREGKHTYAVRATDREGQTVEEPYPYEVLYTSKN